MCPPRDKHLPHSVVRDRVMAIPGVDLVRWTYRVRDATHARRHEVRLYDYKHKPLQLLREDLYWDYRRLLGVEADLWDCQQAFSSQSQPSGSPQASDSSSSVSQDESYDTASSDGSDIGTDETPAASNSHIGPVQQFSAGMVPLDIFWEHLQTMDVHDVIHCSDYTLMRTARRELERDELECKFQC